MKLATSSPFDAPLIDPGFLRTESDVAILTEAVKAAHRFAAAPAWSDYIIAPFIDAVNTTTDADIRDYILNMATTFRHPMGTATVSKAGAKTGVVGPDLLVKGVEGLRIVDASVFVSSHLLRRRDACELVPHPFTSLTYSGDTYKRRCMLSPSVPQISSRGNMVCVSDFSGNTWTVELDTLYRDPRHGMVIRGLAVIVKYSKIFTTLPHFPLCFSDVESLEGHM